MRRPLGGEDIVSVGSGPGKPAFVFGSVAAVLVFTTLMVAIRISPSSPTLHLFFRLARVKNQPRGGSEFSHGCLQTCSW